MRRAHFLATLVALPLGILVVACTSKPPPKMCSAEAPPKHEKGPVSIGMCTNDGPPAPVSDAGPTDAAEGGAEPMPIGDAATASSTKSALAH